LCSTFYVVPYYITPGSYVYNGLVTSVYANSSDPVLADEGSEFYDYLNCSATTSEGNLCFGTSNDYVQSFFGGQYGNRGYNLRNAFILALFLVVARLFTWIALKYIRFSN